MDSTIENLDQYYDSFIDQENNWTFFIGLADYVRYIAETPKIKVIFDNPKEDKQKEIVVLEEAEKEAVKELLEIKGKILDYIKKQHLNNKDIKDALLILSEYETAKISPDYYKSSRLQAGLENLLKCTSENGDEEWVKNNFPIKIQKTFVFEKGNNKSVPKFNYDFEPDKLSKRYRIDVLISKRKDTELWGVREHLVELYKALNHDIGENIALI